MSGIPADTSNSVMSKYLFAMHKAYQIGIIGIGWYANWYRQRQLYHQYHLPLGNGMMVGLLGLVWLC
mgnify:CR=1 FL=1